VYVSSYNPVQSTYTTGLQGWQGGSMGVPFQQSFSLPMQQGFTSAQPFQFQQTMQQPWQSGTFAAMPYNVVSYSFSPAWQTGAWGSQWGSFIPGWGWNQAGAFAGPQYLSGSISPFMAGGFRIESSSGMAQPRGELAETNTDLVITAELPNVNPNDLNLTVTDDSVSISAVSYTGGTAVPLHRTICLPTTIKSEQVNASFSNGILEARLPKSDASVRRKIRVNP